MGFWRGVGWTFVGLMVLGAAGGILGKYLPEPQRTEVPRPQGPIAKFKMKNFNWHRGGFDTVAIVDFTFQNDNDVAVKDALVACDFFAASGTALGTLTQTIYQKFKPRGLTRASNISMGFLHSQARSAHCDVLSVE
jgi:hypothetical protein